MHLFPERKHTNTHADMIHFCFSMQEIKPACPHDMKLLGKARKVTLWVTILKQEVAGGVAQVVEHLASKCEAQSSKPQYHHHQKKKVSKLSQIRFFFYF
jgi:hypothetical protein